MSAKVGRKILKTKQFLCLSLNVIAVAEPGFCTRSDLNDFAGKRVAWNAGMMEC